MAPLVVLTILFKKLPNVSKEEMDEYWSNTHSKIFTSNPHVKGNILKYTLNHTPPADEASNMLSFLSPPSDDHTPRKQKYDGMAQMWAASIGDLEAVFGSEKFRAMEGAMVDGAKFMLPGEMDIFLGWEGEAD